MNQAITTPTAALPNAGLVIVMWRTSRGATAEHHREVAVIGKS